MGDLSARHTSFGDHSENAHGKCPVQRLEPLSGLWTFFNKRGMSIIDHVLANKYAFKKQAWVRVSRHPLLSRSKHALVFGEILGLEEETRPSAPQPRMLADLGRGETGIHPSPSPPAAGSKSVRGGGVGVVY